MVIVALVRVGNVGLVPLIGPIVVMMLVVLLTFMTTFMIQVGPWRLLETWSGAKFHVGVRVFVRTEVL